MLNTVRSCRAEADTRVRTRKAAWHPCQEALRSWRGGIHGMVKFAWSRPAALRLAREIGVLAALSREPAVPFLPKVVASSTDPVLLVTRLVPGTSLFQVVDAIDRDCAGRQLARFLAALHHPSASARPGRCRQARLCPTPAAHHHGPA